MTEEPSAALEAAPEMTYDLSLTGGGLTIKRSVSEAVALSIIATVMGGTLPAGAVVARGALFAPGRSSIGGAALTPGEYLSSVEAKRNPEKIVAFGSYLMDEMHRETFTRDEVRSMFQSAAEPVPGNFHRDFTWAVSNRWLGQQPGTPGAYYVTNPGRAAIKNKFATEVKATTRLGKRRRRKGTPAPSGDSGDK